MPTPHQYYLAVIGKGFDEDGAYGIQCVDGFKHFCRTVVGYNISKKAICSPTGYATSIWDNFNKLGLNKYFDKVAPNKMVDGDWAIWAKGSKPCPSSHIAMFRKDNMSRAGGMGHSIKSGIHRLPYCHLFNHCPLYLVYLLFRQVAIGNQKIIDKCLTKFYGGI